MRGTIAGRMVVIAAAAVIAIPAQAQTPVEQQQQKGPPSSISLESPALGTSKPSQDKSGQDQSGQDKLKRGANSFGEGQARELLESKGYKNVSALMNDQSGIWRGTATRGEEKVQVSVDYQGQIASSPAAEEAKR